MTGEVQGYVILKEDCPSFISPGKISSYQPYCRALEINEHGALLIANDALSVGTVDAEDIRRSVRLEIFNGVACPPDLDTVAKMAYALKATSRKGGYNDLVRQMIIMASLHKGEFCDSLLWQKQ